MVAIIVDLTLTWGPVPILFKFTPQILWLKKNLRLILLCPKLYSRTKKIFKKILLLLLLKVVLGHVHDFFNEISSFKHEPLFIYYF